MNDRALKVERVSRARSVIDDLEPDRKIDPFSERFINLRVASWESASFTDDDNGDGELGFTGQLLALRVVCNCLLINAPCRQHESLSIVAESLIDGCSRSIRFTSTRQTADRKWVRVPRVICQMRRADDSR